MTPLAKMCLCVCGGAAIGGASVHVEHRHHFVHRALHHIAPKEFSNASARSSCTANATVFAGGHGNVSVAQGTNFGYGDSGFGGSYSTTSGGSVYTTSGRSSSSSTSGGHGGHSSSSSGGQTTSGGGKPGVPHDVPEPGNGLLMGLASLAILAGRRMT